MVLFIPPALPEGILVGRALVAFRPQSGPLIKRTPPFSVGTTPEKDSNRNYVRFGHQLPGSSPCSSHPVIGCDVNKCPKL